MVLYAKVWKTFDVFETGIFSFLRSGFESDRTSSHISMFPSCVTNQSWWVLCQSHTERLDSGATGLSQRKVGFVPEAAG